MAQTNDAALRQKIITNPLFDKWLARSAEILSHGANAGTLYPEVWIRDLATFLDLALDHGDREQLRENLRVFFLFQGEDGGVIDGYTQKGKSVHDYKFIQSSRCPDLNGHKNTVETDQESSLVNAVRTYVEKTGDTGFLNEEIAGQTVIERLEASLKFVRTQRWADEYGLVWNGTTIDWGDVQPEHEWGVELDENSHRAICIYTNAMYVIALRDYCELCAMIGRNCERWGVLKSEIAANIRKHLWDKEREKFIPHVYLEGSPFPEDFDESAIYYHGGTACAIQAGLLSPDEVLHAYERMKENQRAAGARTIGLTIWPLYDIPDSPNRVFREPLHYQNGGDWPWFGGRMVQGLIQYGFMAEAYEALMPMLEMTEESGDYNEWHALDGSPMGAFDFRGGAGVLGLAMKQLRQWAQAGSAL